jgi:hypothetical protein
MSQSSPRPETLIEKLRDLPAEKLAEVDEFLDFLAYREDRRLVKAAAKLSEKSFAKVWDNPVDAEYDNV